MQTTHSDTSTAQTAPGDILAAVLAYNARGWRVIDSPHRSKHPGRKGWQQERWTTDELRERFGHDPKNVSLLTGSASQGVSDADLDCTQAVLAAEHLFPSTDAIFGRAGRRRSHRLYQLAPVVAFGRRPFTDPVLKKPDGKPLMLVELRGDAHQTIVPPSAHKDTGEAIAWDTAGEPASVALEALEQAAAETAAVAMLALRWPHLNGSRHDGALALGGFLLRRGCPQERCARLLVALAAAAECPERADEWLRGLDDTARRAASDGNVTGGRRLAEQLGDGGDLVVRRLVSWLGLTDDAAQHTGSTVSVDDESPTGLPLDLWSAALAGTPEFPLDTLPTWLADVVSDVAERTGADVAIPATAALGVAAGALDDRCRFQLHPDDPTYCVSPRLWINGVAVSGGAKTPSQEALLAALEDIEATWIEADEAALAAHDLERQRYEHRLKVWKQGTTDDPPPVLPPAPPRRRRIVKDTTTEALALILVENPGGVLLYFAELAGLLGSFDVYRAAGVQRDRALYLELFDGPRRSIDRAKAGRILVPNWGASILAAIQPEKLGPLLPKLTDDGLFPRFLSFVATHDRPAVRRSPHGAIQQQWRAAIKRLAAISAPVTILPASDVATIRATLDEATYHARQVAGLASGLVSALGKADSQWGRLALTLHALEADDIATPLSGATADRAARLLVDFFLPHLAHLYSEYGQSVALADARRIASWLLTQDAQRVTAREVLRGNRGFTGEPSRLAAAMEILELNSWLHAVPGQRRDQVAWIVNRNLSQRFAARAEAERARREQARTRIRRAVEALHLDTEEDEL
jgi:hypothetical protein